MAETILVSCPYEQVAGGPFGTFNRAVVYQVAQGDGVVIRDHASPPGNEIMPAPNLLVVEIIHPTVFPDAYLQGIEALDDTVVLQGPE